MLLILGETEETKRARTRPDDEPMPKKIRLSKKQIRERGFVIFCSDENETARQEVRPLAKAAVVVAALRTPRRASGGLGYLRDLS